MQVGDPFMGKLLLEACLELFQLDLLEGIQTWARAGLTSSSVEMAGRAQNGIDIDLDLVPRRAKRMSPYEILLSESQERMLLVAKQGCEPKVLEICKKWELDAAVIGHVTDTSGGWCARPLDTIRFRASRSRARARWRAISPLASSPRRTGLRSAAQPACCGGSGDGAQSGGCLRLGRRAACPGGLAQPGIAPLDLAPVRSHRGAAGTAVRPGGDAGVVRVPCEDGDRVLYKYLAFAVDCQARQV